ncbi:hypothetical protein [Vibrio splendidus]|uniref:hypothetical protein n=1 Tax=Vibrio splendidus TaxID=29497 RepID=UPI0006CA32EF|nr:hypothetical protein [Vibrio splendidus]
MKPLTKNESNLVLAVALLAFLLLILFGTLIGATSFEDSFCDVSWTDVLSSFSAFFAAGATVGAVVVAKQALDTWKTQFKTVEAYNATIELEKNLNALLVAYAAYYNSSMYLGMKKYRYTVFNQEVSGQIEKFDLVEQHWELSKVQFKSSFNWSCTFWSDEECNELADCPTKLIGIMDDHRLHMKLKVEEPNSFLPPFDIDSDNAVNTAVSHIKSVLQKKRNITRS